MTTKEFIDTNEIGFKLNQIAPPADRLAEYPGGRHFRCTLQKGDKYFEVPCYSMGAGIKNDPTAEDVLESTVSDVTAYDYNPDLAEFLVEYGFVDEKAANGRGRSALLRKGIKAHEACKEIGEKLRIFLGDEALVNQLFNEVERM
jgi:hypothetical protein